MQDLLTESAPKYRIHVVAAELSHATGRAQLERFRTNLVSYWNSCGKNLRVGGDPHGEAAEIEVTGSSSRLAPSAVEDVPLGQWVHELYCAVPIQIARAENGGLSAFRDGIKQVRRAVCVLGGIRTRNYVGWIGCTSRS